MFGSRQTRRAFHEVQRKHEIAIAPKQRVMSNGSEHIGTATESGGTCPSGGAGDDDRLLLGRGRRGHLENLAQEVGEAKAEVACSLGPTQYCVGFQFTKCAVPCGVTIHGMR